MRLKSLSGFLACSSLLLAASGSTAVAATATATMAVTATVLSVCTITAVPLVFGNYSSGVLDATSTLTVICSLSTPFNIGLDAGSGSGATIATRRMTNGASTLQYTLSSNAARTLNIGQTVGTDTVTGTGTGIVQAITVYGRIAANQYVAAGAYTDTVTATITY